MVDCWVSLPNSRIPTLWVGILPESFSTGWPGNEIQQSNWLSPEFSSLHLILNWFWATFQAKMCTWKVHKMPDMVLCLCCNFLVSTGRISVMPSSSQLFHSQWVFASSLSLSLSLSLSRHVNISVSRTNKIISRQMICVFIEFKNNSVRHVVWCRFSLVQLLWTNETNYRHVNEKVSEISWSQLKDPKSFSQLSNASNGLPQWLAQLVYHDREVAQTHTDIVAVRFNPFIL